MKNLTKIFMAVVALFAVSCVTDTTDDLGVNLGEGQTTISLSLEETKTHLGTEVDGEYPLYWSEGDKIAVNGVTSNALPASAHGQQSATFKIGGLLNYPRTIVYPAPAEGVTAATAGNYPVTFSATQAYKAGSFAEGAAPMYAYQASSNDAVTLNHLSGVLRFAPYGEGVTLKALTVTAETGALAGNFDVAADGTLTAHADATGSVTVTFGEGLALGATEADATPIYVAVPAGEFGAVTVTLYTNSGSMVRLFQTNGNAINAGKVREFPAFAYVANGEDDGSFRIYDEASLLEFATNAATTTSAKVVANVDMTNKTWSAIEGFAGAFDGGNHEIKGLTAPLFGTTTATSIQNVHLVGVNIVNNTDTRRLGAVACVVDNTSAVIQNCSAQGTMTLSGARGGTTDVVASYCYIAGVIGQTTTTQKVTGLVNKVNISVGDEFEVYGRPYISGCVVDTDGELENCTNLGTIETRADLICHTTLYVGGVVWNATKITSCVNGSANSGESQKLGAITINGSVDRSCFMGGVTSNNTGKIVVSGCKNYAPLKLYAETTTSSEGNVFAAGVVAIYNNVTTITNCENYGDIDCKFKTNTNPSYIGGVTAGNSSNYFTGISDCSNHGNITIDGTDINTTLMVGGVINIMESKATYTNLTNTGDISINNFASKKDGYIIAGGIAGRIKKNTNTTLTGNMVNEGDITLSGTLNRTDGKTIRVGGFVGLLETLPPTISVTFTNSGDITFNGTSNSDIKLGGIIGACAQVVTLNNSTQTGDVTCAGTVASGKKAYVGGIVGGDDASIRGYVSGVRCFCNVKAPGYTNVGMISGLAYDSANPFSNCHIGGTIQRGDATTATPLALSNYTTLAYSDTPEKESFVNVDKCGWLANENADPQWDYVPGITIGSADELLQFAEDVKANPALADIVGLTADIDMTDEEWTPIEGFAGVFDGKDYEIKGLTAPLFGTTQASLQNIHLTDVNIVNNTDTRKLGAVACFVDNASATIQNCSAQGTMALSGARGGTPNEEASKCYIGGVIGKTTTTQKVSGLLNKVNITFTGTIPRYGFPYIAGCIVQTSGEVENCTNLGTITVDKNTVIDGTIYVVGVVYNATKVTSCVNGSPEEGEIQTLGALTLDATIKRVMYFGGITTTASSMTAPMTDVRGCYNYGTINLGATMTASSTAFYTYVGGIVAYIDELDTISDCHNYGNINISLKKSNVSGNAYVSGVGTSVGDGIDSMSDCSNHGNIHFTKDADINRTVMVGGVIDVLDANNATFHNLRNTGDILIEGNIATYATGSLLVGGVGGRINDATASCTGYMINEGDITCSGDFNKNGSYLDVGGVLGRISSISTTKATAIFENSGKVTFNGYAEGESINIGGLFGICDKVVTLNARNTGNIECAGTLKDGVEAYVGGLVGGYRSTRGALSGARCFCTLKAIGYENVGMVTGLAYDSTAEPFTNCHIGGYIVDEEGGEPVEIEDYDFYTYIYGNRNCQPEDIRPTYCGWLDKSINDTPIDVDGNKIE